MYNVLWILCVTLTAQESPESGYISAPLRIVNELIVNVTIDVKISEKNVQLEPGRRTEAVGIRIPRRLFCKIGSQITRQ